MIALAVAFWLIGLGGVAGCAWLIGSDVKERRAMAHADRAYLEALKRMSR